MGLAYGASSLSCDHRFFFRKAAVETSLIANPRLLPRQSGSSQCLFFFESQTPSPLYPRLKHEVEYSVQLSHIDAHPRGQILYTKIYK